MKKKLGEKSIVIVFGEKESKAPIIGLVQEMRLTEKEIIADVKPLVVKICFEGDRVTLTSGLPRKDRKKLWETIKKFESSKDEVLIISGKGTEIVTKKEFNRRLESDLHKTVTDKYLQELRKSLKKGYVV